MEANRVITGEVRFSYTHLTEAYKSPNAAGDPKFGATILLPKGDTATKARIDAAIEAAKAVGKDRCWGGAIPPVCPTPVHDGDGGRPSDGMPFGDECKGHWVFTAGNKMRPDIVDEAMNPIIDATALYSGMYGRVGLTFYAYNSNGRKGVGVSLDTVQKLRDGEPLGSHRSAAEDFGGAPQPQYQAPVQPQYPQYAQPPYQAPVQPQYPQYAQPPYQQYAAPQAPVDPITGMPMQPAQGGYYGL